MKANDSGVAKWSMFLSTTSVASGKRVDERIAGTGEVVVADADEHRAGDGGEPLGVGPRRGSLQHEGQRLGVVAGLAGVLGEQLRADVAGVALTADGGDDLVAALLVVAEEVGADAAHDELAEALRLSAGQLEEGGGPEREPDRVDGDPSGGRASTIRVVRSS